MRVPQIVVVESDGWLAKQLRELAGESRWMVQTVRSVDTALLLMRQRQPVVLLVQVEPAEDKPEPLGLIADVHRLAPDVPIIAVSDVKLPDAERTAWTAVLLDLGARYVLFPPLTRPVLEDVVSGLMTAAIGRVIGESAPSKPARTESVIDLADEGAEA
jgi:DNA-binding response OmpR family regulator